VLRALILALLVGSTIFFWLGIPVLTLWGLSRVTEEPRAHFVVGVVAVPAAMAAFVPFLLWLNGLYTRSAGAELRPHGRRRRRTDPLEPLLMVALLISIVAVTLWFLLFAENPPRRFI
jgi:hypothetical protein